MQVGLRRPAAWAPLAVSAAALALVLGYAVGAGITPHAGERAPARIFQVLMLSDACLIALYAVRWLPVSPGSAFRVVALQVVCALVPVAAVLVLEALA